MSCEGSEGLANYLFALLPESFGVFGIEGVGADAFADGGEGRVGGNDAAHVAVLAILRTDLIGLCDDGGPDGGGGSLGDGLPLEGRLAGFGELLVDAVDEALEHPIVHVASELSLDASGMNGGGADATAAMTLVEGNGEEDVRGLRSAVGDEGLVGRALEVGVFEVDVGITVACRGQIDEAAAGAQQRSDAVDEDEVAEMIGAELRLEAVGGAAEGSGHDPGVGDDDVEEAALVEQRVGGGANALEVCEIELDELEAATVGRGFLADFSCGVLCLGEVACGADDVGSVGGERTGGLDAESGGDAGDKDALAAQIDSGENLIGG